MLKLVRQDVMNKEEFSEVALVICPLIFSNKAIKAQHMINNHVVKAGL